MKKKLLSLLLALCLVMALVPMTAFAEGTSVDNWDGTADTSWYTDHKTDTEYHFTTAEQLAGLAQLVNDKTASVSFEETGDFNILLGQDGDKSISLTAEGGKVFFKMAGVKSDKIQFVSSVEKCRNAEIFVDGRTIEVYLNDGEDVGTRLFYNSNRQGIFCLNSEKDAQVKICEMKSIWK